MSYAPATLLELRAYLQSKTGLSPVSLGIVGNTAHVRGYHLGKDRIFSLSGIGWSDYSVRLTRDKNGLTNAASAMDIGNFTKLRSLSMWLVRQCQLNAPGTQDIREIIYSPDGITVLRYDRARGYNSAPRTGEADNSHRTHTHISWYRDSQNRGKVDLFKRYFNPGYWGRDIPDWLSDKYSSGDVRKVFQLHGITFGKVINMVDLEALFKHFGINYATSIQDIDMIALRRAIIRKHGIDIRR